MKFSFQKGVVSIFAAVWIASVAVPIGVQASSDTAAYPDVPADYYASQEISLLKQKGIVDAEEDGGFHPNDAVTRGDAAEWLSKALKLSKPKSLNAFKDVAETSPYAEAVNALKEQNIVQGNDGLYQPDALLTREQMASLLVRAFQLKDNGIQAWLKDEATISKAHHDDVIKLKQNFITDQLAFMPQDQVTRAQLVLFIYRTISQKEETSQGSYSLDDFLQLPNKIGMRLSPDGKTLAYLQPWENRMNLYIQKVGETQSTRITSSKNENIGQIYWITDKVIVYVQDTDGTENTHLRAVKVDGSGDIDLTPYANVKSDLLDVLPAKNESDIELLLTMNKRDPKVMDVYRVKLSTGETNMQVQNPGNVNYWITDNWGEVRAAIARDGETTNLLYREDESKAFTKIDTFNSKDNFIPVMFTFNNEQIYAASNVGRDKMALVEYDPITKKETKVLYMNNDVDIDNFIVSYKKQSILAVSYETDDKQMHYLDNEFEALSHKIEEKLQNRHWGLIGSPDRDVLLLHTESDKTYGSYYLYDRKSDKLDKVTDIQPKFDEKKMADMQPVSFKSRDGLTIHGYLTFPKGVDANKLPVVVNPHGGPWYRDTWGYNMEAQLLANQGYAVLQLNFRGSTGYGKAFLHAGDKQWGKAMQNDITDGVNWLIKRGTADPERVAIYGASYGGYATLAGLTFTPDLFAAGVDYVGPSNLLSFMSTMPPYWEIDRPQMYQQVGDPVKDKNLLESASPLLHVDQIKAPLMIAQGVNDPRVNKAESDQMVAALRKLDVDVPYMVKKNEGHGFGKLENARDFYQALIHFLNQNVKNKKKSA
ncbi:S9 family peptidase [Paenibacillus aceris]|uniref:Dipeptidyl aminopeptidase/acylaminoacyl peptidase n=1 Tax=Paenibacillus aceris TaxID=869555 RepID=A0ABS4I1W8_9BACL|nr:prolyl oligopeptidase family serine peptidase [Paenibacillus aceris]MBP1964556.1 dipeptidyl aminopeptidase/acylaminoacyl peptidase [Paenibacillus aceris]NHW35735.1 prolyl oligopeptidase family serine peptidase [Paenibacillus aceris]